MHAFNLVLMAALFTQLAARGCVYTGTHITALAISQDPKWFTFLVDKSGTGTLYNHRELWNKLRIHNECSIWPPSIPLPQPKTQGMDFNLWGNIFFIPAPSVLTRQMELDVYNYSWPGVLLFCLLQYMVRRNKPGSNKLWQHGEVN